MTSIVRKDIEKYLIGKSTRAAAPSPQAKENIVGSALSYNFLSTTIKSAVIRVNPMIPFSRSSCNQSLCAHSQK